MKVMPFAIVGTIGICLTGFAGDLGDDQNVARLLNNEKRRGDIKNMALLPLSLRESEATVEKNKQEFKKNWWCFCPDIKIEKWEMTVQENKFDLMFADLRKTVCIFEIEELHFVGYDDVAVLCNDYYFSAVTRRGPVILRYRFQLGDRGLLARFFSLDCYTNPDDVKQMYRGIQHRASSDNVLTIRLNRTSTNEDKPSRPSDNGEKSETTGKVTALVDEPFKTCLCHNSLQ